MAEETAKLSGCSPEQVIVNVAKRAAVSAFQEEEKNTILRIAGNLLSLGVGVEDVAASTGLKKDECAKLKA